MGAILTALVVTPCVTASPIDTGERAPCSGVLISADQARKAIKDREEVKVRRAFSCPECPTCPACPQPKRPRTLEWTMAGVLVGAVLALSLKLAWLDDA